MAIQVIVNMVTAEVSVNAQPVECEVLFAPANVEIQCCGSGVLGVPVTGNVADILTKTGAGATDYAWLPPGSSASFEIYQAGESLSSGRVVVIDNLLAMYFQHSDVAHVGRAYGVTKTSAAMGANVTIQVYGVLQDAAFNFVADTSLWVGADGEIFNTQQVGGVIIQKAGVAAENKKMMIDFSIQILKN